MYVVHPTNQCCVVCVCPVSQCDIPTHMQESSAMDTSGGAVGVPPPAPPSTFQVSQVRGPEAFLTSTAPTQVCVFGSGHHTMQVRQSLLVCLQLLTKRHLEDLLQEVDPHQLLDEDVAEVRAQGLLLASGLTGVTKHTCYCHYQALLQMADDYIESVVAASCELARHRKSSTLEVKDVQLHLGEWAGPRRVRRGRTSDVLRYTCVQSGAGTCGSLASEWRRGRGSVHLQQRRTSRWAG